MNLRRTARVLLFDPDQRLLLMKVDDRSVRDPAKPLLTRYWVTLGGKVEPGESVAAAAAREVLEETGLTDITVGPTVWHGEQVLHVSGEPTRFIEGFIVVRTRATHLSSHGWTPEEQRAILEMRWWTLSDIERTRETILPPVLKTLIRGVALGEAQDGVRTISLSVTEIE